MESDRLRWDERYRTATRDGDGRPRAAAPDVLASNPDLAAVLPNEGTALDVACGTGAQSLWLAERGLSVTALDVSPVAVDALARAADRAGVDIDARVADTDDGLPAELVDLDVIVCQRYRAVALYPAFVARLAPGGVLVLTVLSAVGLDGVAGDFHAPAGELLDHFGQLDEITVLHHAEGDGRADIVAMKR